ncbi:DinB family protein [Actinomycetospora termitidis]|uniref:DinB family protein n=1 Tax=Actinomycetospora termitidis TaxID=3053470 RepID=A0ABT7MGA4_9PSEU|nr:DinB family protein [Actinomycetospora sp. Odt1-22]MDL5159194.1 DinB family protein [Actinomycetospora sp. Odt1-22]
MSVTPEVPVSTDPSTLTGERRDLVETLQMHRALFLQTLQGITEEQARTRTTFSVLNLAGLVKHVARTEAGWLAFAKEGPAAMAMEWPEVDWDDPVIQARLAEGDLRHDEFNLLGDETLESMRAYYAKVADETDAYIAEADLDVSWPLPEAPWFAPGATRSVRRVAMHIVAETAQHAGHADFLREAIDGVHTM